MSDELEDHRGFFQAEMKLKFGMLEAEIRAEREYNRTTTQLAQDYKKLLSCRTRDPPASASEATEPDAPAACGSGQLVRAPQEAPVPPSSSVRRSAAGSDDTPNTPVNRRRGGEHQGSMPVRDRRPGMERSAHTRTRANLDLGGTICRNAARAGAAYAGTNPRRRASAQAQVSAPLFPGNRFDNDRDRDPRKLLLREAGVNPSMAMTPEDLDLAKNTPLITGRSFNALFGGNSSHERPMCEERNILCVNRKAQTYAPHSPGKSGLVFLNPDIVLLEDVWETFHLFLNKNPKLSGSERQIHYLGTYTKVPIVHATLEPNEWSSLPNECSDAWVRRIKSSDAHKGHARTRTDIKAAFRFREEKIKFEVINYARYDHNIATRLQTTLLQGDLA